MSIVVRYNPPSLTTEQYDEADRRLREAGVEPLGLSRFLTALSTTSASVRKGTCVSARSGTLGSSSRRTASS
jgi:hypothetical protein